MKKNKILIVTEVFYPEEFNINDLALSWQEKGFEINVLTLVPSYPENTIVDGYKNKLFQKEKWRDITIFRIKTVKGCRTSVSKKILKYFWFIHNNAYIIRKDFIDQILNDDKPSYMNFLFDGNNFRGYLSETEIIAKCYSNDWAAGITTKVFAEEDESLLLNKREQIKTESYESNLDLYIDEGLAWIKKKYGFNSRWQMMQYSKLMYDNFFEYFPEEKINKI